MEFVALISSSVGECYGSKSNKNPRIMCSCTFYNGIAHSIMGVRKINGMTLSALNLTATLAKPWIGFMLNMFCQRCIYVLNRYHLCPKSGPDLPKTWLFTSVIQDTNVIVSLKLLTTTGTNVTAVLCAGERN